MPLVKLIFILMHILLAGLVFHFLQFLQPTNSLQPVASACAISSAANTFRSSQYLVGESDSTGPNPLAFTSHNKNKAKESVCNTDLKTRTYFPFCFRI